MSQQIIEVARQEIRLTLEKLINEARDVVDAYWLEWRMTNKRLLDEERKRLQPTGYLRGNVAPRIVERTGKTYIEWIVYSPGRYGARSKSWGERIPPRKGPVYHMSQFTKKTQSWEYDMIEKAEEKLRPLRYAMERIHGAQAYLSRLLSKMDKVETENDET